VAADALMSGLHWDPLAPIGFFPFPPDRGFFLGRAVLRLEGDPHRRQLMRWRCCRVSLTRSKSAVADFDRYIEWPKPAYTRFQLGEGRSLPAPLRRKLTPMRGIPTI